MEFGNPKVKSDENGKTEEEKERKGRKAKKTFPFFKGSVTVFGFWFFFFFFEAGESFRYMAVLVEREPKRSETFLSRERDCGVSNDSL